MCNKADVVQIHSLHTKQVHSLAQRINNLLAHHSSLQGQKPHNSFYFREAIYHKTEMIPT